MEALLAAGATVDSLDMDLETPLHHAAAQVRAPLPTGPRRHAPRRMLRPIRLRRTSDGAAERPPLPPLFVLIGHAASLPPY